MGVRGFLISCANFLATFSHASCRSVRSNLSCWVFKRSIIKLKFLFNDSSSLSVFISGTLVSKFPLPILIDAFTKLLIDLKNLEENLIAIETLKNSIKETTIK